MMSYKSSEKSPHISQIPQKSNDSREFLISECKSPIDIDGNSDWENNSYVTGGGILEDPYIIANYDIDAGQSESGIKIRRSNKHVTIKNCVIYNSKVSTNGGGIYIENSSNIDIINCTIYGNSNLGISLQSSTQILILENNISQNLHGGVQIQDSKYITVSRNFIANNIDHKVGISGGSGIYLLSTEICSISDNNILNNTYGIHIEDSPYNFFSENDILSNEHSGFCIYSSKENEFNQNKLWNNGFCIDEFERKPHWYYYYDPARSTDLLIKDTNTVNGKAVLYYEKESEIVLDGDEVDAGQIILVDCSDIIIRDFLLTATIFLIYSEGCSLINNVISDTSCSGIVLSNSQNNVLSSNIISSASKNGIFFLRSPGNQLNDNEIRDSNGFGISFYESSNISLSSNRFFNDGIYLYFSFDLHIDQTNTVNKKPLHYYEKKNAVEIDGNTEEIGLLMLISCTDFVIKNCEISNTDISIYLFNSDRITLIGNKFSSNSKISGLIYPIPVVERQGFLSISRSVNVLILASQNTLIVNNSITDIDGIGIFLHESSNNMISGNKIECSETGIDIWDTSNITLNSNTISARVGISSYWNSYKLTLTFNKLINCGISIANDYINGNTIDNTNTINSKPILYHENKNNIEFDGMDQDVGLLIFLNCSGVTIKNFEIEGGDSAIYLTGCRAMKISNNSLVNNSGNGIYIWRGSGDYLISGNNIKNNGGNGIFINEAENYPVSLKGMISNNIIENNGKNGINIYSSNNFTIDNNSINENDHHGVSIVDSDGCTVRMNAIALNNHGIHLFRMNSKRVTIANNTFTDNAYDIFGLSCKGIITKRQPISDQTPGLPIDTGIVLIFIFLTVEILYYRKKK